LRQGDFVKRLDLKVGYACNNMCRHCAQGSKRSTLAGPSSEELRHQMEEACKRGIKSVVFTGGEPTVRPDLLELVRQAKDMGYREIQIQTNGRRFASPAFTRAAINSGMTEFSPALNGHIPALHDYLAQVPGAWRQTVRGIMNVRECSGIKIISNTVITKPNYRFADRIARLLVSLGVDQFQLAFVHPCGSAWTNFDAIVPFISLATPHIHKGLQVGLDAGLHVMAEAMPYCHMQGYEDQVSELYIPPSDVYEAGTKIKDWEKWRIQEGKWKGDSCKTCRYYQICEGPWREYVERRGPSEFIPVPVQ